MENWLPGSFNCTALCYLRESSLFCDRVVVPVHLCLYHGRIFESTESRFLLHLRPGFTGSRAWWITRRRSGSCRLKSRASSWRSRRTQRYLQRHIERSRLAFAFSGFSLYCSLSRFVVPIFPNNQLFAWSWDLFIQFERYGTGYLVKPFQTRKLRVSGEEEQACVRQYRWYGVSHP